MSDYRREKCCLNCCKNEDELCTNESEPCTYCIGYNKGRADAIAEVRNGINNIISEYGVNGKVLSDLIMKYVDFKCDWLKEKK